MYVNQTPAPKVTKIIACKHAPAETKQELFILVDHGVTIQQVIVEHAIYGEITASLMLSTRLDVEAFCQKVEQTNSSLLSELTDGVHLHVIEADHPSKLEAAVQALTDSGFILQD